MFEGKKQCWSSQLHSQFKSLVKACKHVQAQEVNHSSRTKPLVVYNLTHVLNDAKQDYATDLTTHAVWVNFFYDTNHDL